MRVLVVCHGNINRSPLCAAVLQTFSGLDVRQAGLKPGLRPGPVAKKMRDAAEEWGFPLAGKSTPLTEELLLWADRVVYMDGGNLGRLVKFGAGLTWADPICLGAYAQPPTNRIPDPAFIRRADPRFDAVVKLIIDSSLRLGLELQKIAQDK